MIKPRFLLLGALSALLAAGCTTPQPGPDKTIGGTVLGAAWGAGAGAVIGNQLEFGRTGEGAAVGAGFGAVSGAMAGLNYDIIEDTQIEQDKELASLRVHNQANAAQLAQLQGKLDKAIASDLAGGVYQVFFDPDSTSLRAGSVANLEVIADSIMNSPRAAVINVVGHTDDTGQVEYNDRVAEARARSVSAYLAARGISSNQIRVQSFGAKRPIASNTTETGRQLNRRVDVYISH